jgi:predicted nucleic acid-binding protein
MSEMVDTLVLIYGCRRMTGKEDLAHQQMCVTSEDLLKRLDEINISAISWLEFLRGARGKEDPEKLQAVERKLRVLATDAAIARKANDLLTKREIQQKTCFVCLASALDKPCTKCGKNGSAVQRVNDAILVATAELTVDITVLYSFDGGVLAYSGVVSRCAIKQPAHPAGPLFEPTLTLKEPETTPPATIGSATATTSATGTEPTDKRT